jgi:hypothetical protein
VHAVWLPQVSYVRAEAAVEDAPGVDVENVWRALGRFLPVDAVDRLHQAAEGGARHVRHADPVEALDAATQDEVHECPDAAVVLGQPVGAAERKSVAGGRIPWPSFAPDMKTAAP